MAVKPVLVVDDEPQIRTLVRTLLSQVGLHSIEACDGASAIAAAQRLNGEISLLLTDINMPDSTMNGIELAGAMRLQFPEIPVVFVSSDSEQAPAGDLFVMKPFDLKAFHRTVRELVAA